MEKIKTKWWKTLTNWFRASFFRDVTEVVICYKCYMPGGKNGISGKGKKEIR